MGMSKVEAREVLQTHGLRATAPRIDVLRALAEQDDPIAHNELVRILGGADYDPATVFRNLVKLKEAGIAPVVSRAGGIDRYALVRSSEETHEHPHFVCEDCGKVACIPVAIPFELNVEGPWADSVRSASVQLQGECPDCMAAHDRGAR